MSISVFVILAISVVATATLSGIFGMAGGIVLMGVLAVLLPVQGAMMLHGAVQAVSNGYRAILHRREIRWHLLGGYGLGAVLALVALAGISYVPSKTVLFFVLGAMPFVAAALPRSLQLDITKRGSAVLCGFIVTLLNLVAGVAGPLLDIFYVRTPLTRHQVVATKAITQALSHLMKLVYFGLLIGGDGVGDLSWWLFVVLPPLAIPGTLLGKRILDRLSDHHFRRYSQYVLYAIGAVLLVRGSWMAIS